MLADKSFSFSQTLVEFGFLLEEMGLISHGFFTDPKKASARLVYFAFQFGVSFFGAVYAPLLYECPVQAVLAIITINMVGVWHGLSYYIKFFPTQQWTESTKCQCQTKVTSD